MLGFAATRDTLHTITTDRTPTGRFGFTSTRAPEGTSHLSVTDPADDTRVFCTSLDWAYGQTWAVQNTRGRFGRPGLVAPLTIHGK